LRNFLGATRRCMSILGAAMVFSLRNGATVPEKKFPRHRAVDQARRESSPQGEKIENVRVLRADSLFAVRYLLPESSVETFTFCFRIHGRSGGINCDAFSRAIFWMQSPLRWGKHGVLCIATDQLDYFQQVERLSHAHLQFQVLPRSPDDAVLPVTKFEKKFRDEGAPIYRLTLRKTSPVR
jgi:Predicted S-adenosylmethionine-dependent methyltransferase